MTQRAFFICAYCLWFAYAGQNGKIQPLHDIAAKMCPFTRFCHTNATKNLGKEQKQDDLCCYPCSCEPDCWETSSCCLDKDGIGEKTSDFKCKETLVKRNFADPYVYQGIQERYNIIDFCPETQKDVDSMCKAREPVMLEELVWVSNKNNGIIYQNQYCAQCHGVTNFVHWRIKTDCQALLQTNFSTLFDDLSGHSCSVNNKPPGIIRHLADRYVCFKPRFDACNKTDQLAHFDPDISAACESINSPVFHRNSIGRYNIYKNVFCYLCNGNSEAEFTEFCPGHLDPGKSELTAFSALINFKTYMEIAGDTKSRDQYERVCRIDEIFDSYLERCRTLFCPFGRTAVYGQCEQVLTEVDGLNLLLMYHLKIEAISNSSTYLADHTRLKSFAQNIITLFEASSGLGRSICSVCIIRVFLLDKSDDPMLLVPTFYLVVILTTNLRCPLDNVINIANEFVKNDWTVYATDTDYFVIQAAIDTRSIHEIQEEASILAVKSFKIRCLADTTISSSQICPAVDLIYTEILALEESKLKTVLLSLFEMKQHPFGALRICLDEYQSFMSQRISAAARIVIVLFYQLIYLCTVFQF